MRVRPVFPDLVSYPLNQHAVAVKIRKLPITVANASGDELHFLPLCSPLPRKSGLESFTKLPAFNQNELQRLNKDMKLSMS